MKIKVPNISKHIPTAVTKVAGRQALKVQAYSPTILFATGIVGIVATTVLASRATLKLNEILEEGVTKKHVIEDTLANPEMPYDDHDAKRDLKVLKAVKASAIVKLYAPAFAVGAISVTCLAGSHYILTTRNAGLMAAYAALEEGFDKYRQRVIAEFGDEKDRDLRFGSEEAVIMEENGEGRKITRVGEPGPSVYAKFFDEYSKNWQRQPEYNRIFLQTQQSYHNNLLHARGHVFLNEVYDALGIERTKAGAVVGWILNKAGDNFVDFGIFEDDSARLRDFVNGREGSILLDFNVDGVIFDKLDD